MTASKKAVRTRRGVEPTGRPARREVELGKRSTNELVHGTDLRGRTLLIRKLGRSDATNDVRDGSSHTKIASESMIPYCELTP